MSSVHVVHVSALRHGAVLSNVFTLGTIFENEISGRAVQGLLLLLHANVQQCYLCSGRSDHEPGVYVIIRMLHQTCHGQTFAMIACCQLHTVKPFSAMSRGAQDSSQ